MEIFMQIAIVAAFTFLSVFSCKTVQQSANVKDIQPKPSSGIYLGKKVFIDPKLRTKMLASIRDAGHKNKTVELRVISKVIDSNGNVTLAPFTMIEDNGTLGTAPFVFLRMANVDEEFNEDLFVADENNGVSLSGYTGFDEASGLWVSPKFTAFSTRETYLLKKNNQDQKVGTFNLLKREYFGVNVDYSFKPEEYTKINKEDEGKRGLIWTYGLVSLCDDQNKFKCHLNFEGIAPKIIRNSN